MTLCHIQAVQIRNLGGRISFCCKPNHSKTSKPTTTTPQWAHGAMNLFDLSGEVAVVIGATGVLGGALAEGLGESGARVAVLGRNAERGRARAKKILA